MPVERRAQYGAISRAEVLPNRCTGEGDLFASQLPCQGRICGPIVSAVIAEARGLPIAEIGTYRPRAPYKPITVGALAGWEAAG